MKRPRRLAVLAALCGTVARAGWLGAVPAGRGLLGIESDGAPEAIVMATGSEIGIAADGGSVTLASTNQ